MALIKADFFSAALMRTVQINVILPTDKLMNALASEGMVGSSMHYNGTPEHSPYAREPKRFQTLYLLHGIFGSNNDWVTGTNIQRWAEERDLAVVMPSGENMFYIDQPNSHNLYGRFIGEELVAATRAMFPLSPHREDTFIAGLSMGGYGALRNGLKYCETFGCVGGLSSAMVIDSVEEAVQGGGLFFTTRPYLESVFGDLGSVRDSDKDPARLAADLVYCDRPRPRVYMACGTEDGLLGGNRALQDRLRGVGLDVTYEEGPGGHDWDFWNRYLEHLLNWLPLGPARAGMNSGNVF